MDKHVLCLNVLSICIQVNIMQKKYDYYILKKFNVIFDLF